MMPLDGGAADKAGNSYERRWTVFKLIDVLGGEAKALRIEVPGEAGVGSEFRVTLGALNEWHQAKRQRDGGPWTIANMAAEGVLAPWQGKLSGGDRCVFVSSTGAQELRELVERAGQAESWDEFSREFLASNQQVRFDRLRRAWGYPPDEDVYAALHAVEVALIGEPQLEQWINHRLEALVTGPASTAADVLNQLVNDSVHQDLTAADVWERLSAREILPRNLRDDAAVVGRLAAMTLQHRQRLRRLYVGGQEIPRPEAREAFSKLVDGQRVLIAGGAGSGKSVIVNHAIEEATGAGWTTCVIAVDRLPAAETTKQLGDAYALPDSPVTVLASVASGGDALLVIDQLDAVSVASGRHPERIGLIEDLLGEAAAHRRLRVIMASRQFDLDNDRQLRAMAAAENTEVIGLGELSDEHVRQALRDANLAEDIPRELLKLLAVPLHLALYVELATGGQVYLTSARSLTQLHEAYWQHKRQACRAAREGADEWSKVIDRLVDHMSARQELSVPAALLDDQDEHVSVMASQGVLVVDAGRISFFHETFFDHCCARRLVGSGQTIRDLLSGQEQDLFRRAQVRQMLVYERDVDFHRYVDDLTWLLTSDDVRLHLKALVIALTQTLNDPRPEEWAVLRDIANDPDHALHHRLWQTLRQNPEWLPVLEASGGWSNWLRSDDPTVVRRTTWALSGMATGYPAESIQLLGTLPEDSNVRELVVGFLGAAGLHHGRALLDRFLTAIEDGWYDAGGNELWWPIRSVGDHQPGWAVEVVASLLRRGIKVSDTAGVRNPFDLPGPLNADRQSLASATVEAAALDPDARCVEQLLPAMLDIAQRNELPDRGDGRLRRDGVWGLRVYGFSHELQHYLHASMEKALQTLAAASPVRAAAVFDELRTSPLETAGFLLARGYLGNPQEFANEAAAWLAQTPGALHLGYTDSSHWVSRELIAAISPFCGDPQLDGLMTAIIGYAPRSERTYQGLKSRGYAELCLLNGLDPSRRPEAANKRLAELRRKFSQDDVTPPRGVIALSAEPPIPEDRARRMTDEQWVRAMTRHGISDARFTSNGSLVGDAYAQAQVLEGVTKEEPARFARLFIGLPAVIPEPYLEAIVRGLTGARLEPDLLLDVCRHAEQRGSSEVNRWLVRLIQGAAATTLSHELLDIVSRIASGDPDPTASGNEPDIDAGINTTRGAAALTLAELIGEDATRLPRVADALEHVALDPDPSVRDMAIIALTTTLHVDARRALDLFHATLETALDQLLASNNIERFLHHAVRLGHYDEVADVLDRLAANPADEARQAAARQLAVASLNRPELDGRVDAALGGDEPTRAGIAQVFAANLPNKARRDRIVGVLTRSFSDPSRSVREAASRCFYRIEGERLDGYEETINAFANSLAVQDDLGGVLHVVEASRHPLPPAVLDLCEQFVATRGPEIGDISTAAAGDASEIVRLAIRLHAQHRDPDARRRCLDVIDRLVALGAYGIDGELRSVER